MKQINITNNETGWTLIKVTDNNWVLNKGDKVIFQDSIDSAEWELMVARYIGVGQIKGLDVEIKL